MKLKILLIVTTLLLFSFGTLVAQERLFDALGYESFYKGLSFKKFMPNNTLQLALGMRFVPSKVSNENPDLDLRAALRIRGKFWDSKRVKVERFIEGGIVIEDTHQQDRTRMNFHISIGFIPEVFVTEKFSLEIPLGIGLVLVGKSAPNANDDSMIITTFESDSELNISFHVYF